MFCSLFKSKNNSENLQPEIFTPNPDFGLTTCIKFNHFQNQTDQKLWNVTNNHFDKLSFTIGDQTPFSYLVLFFSDNFSNELDWSQFITSIRNQQRSTLLYYDLTKRVETKLGTPYNDCTEDINDGTYRKKNCVSLCKSKQFVQKYNCTLESYYSVRGYPICNIEMNGM